MNNSGLALTIMSLFAAVSSVAVEEAKETVEIQLLATSDIHGKMLPYDYALDAESTSGSLAQISTLIKELRTDNTILIDTGDLIQGNSADLFLEDEIHPMIQGLNTVGYDIWVLGNHEFNYDVDTLEKIIGQSEQTVLWLQNTWEKTMSMI